jgi:hypothetical protein
LTTLGDPDGHYGLGIMTGFGIGIQDWDCCADGGGGVGMAGIERFDAETEAEEQKWENEDAAKSAQGEDSGQTVAAAAAPKGAAQNAPVAVYDPSKPLYTPNGVVYGASGNTSNAIYKAFALGAQYGEESIGSCSISCAARKSCHYGATHQHYKWQAGTTPRDFDISNQP